MGAREKMNALAGRRITIADLGGRHAIERPTPAAAPAVANNNKRSPVSLLLAELVKKYPIIFDKQKPKPLVIGAFELIQADLGCDPRTLAYALKYWCGRPQYRAAISAAEHRYGLDGTPSGAVTEEQRRHAREVKV